MRLTITKLVLIVTFFFAIQRSASAEVVVLGKLIQDKVVSPGDSFHGVLLLQNTESRDAYVRLYQTDYLFYSDGRNTYGNPGGIPRSNADWITLGQDRIVIPPKSTIPVQYEGKVPTGQDLNGTYWSAIMVEPFEPIQPAVPGDKDRTLTVQTLVRFLVQVATDIGSSGAGQLKIKNKALVNNNGKIALQIEVENTGDRKITPALSTELFDSQGKPAGKFDGGKWRIYPTCSVRFIVDLQNVPAGKYTALVVMDSGEDNVVGAQYVLEINP